MPLCPPRRPQPRRRSASARPRPRRAFGRDKSGEELPKWVADKKKRAEKIRAAKAELEAEPKAAAAAKAKAQAEAEEQRRAEGRKKPGKPAAPPSEEPDPKAQKNFTDPESRIMRKSETVRKSGGSSPTMLMKSTRSRAALAIRRDE